MSLFPQILFIFVCLLGSAFFAGIETGIISVQRLRLRHLVHRRDPKARIILHFLEHPNHFLGTTLTGVNLCTVAASVTSTHVATHLLGAWGIPVSQIGITLVILVCCEYLPKSWFRSAPAKRALPFAYLLQAMGYLFYPLSRSITWISHIIVPEHRFASDQLTSSVTREDLNYLIREASQTGALSSAEHRMIHGVFALNSKPVAQIMTPYEKMILVAHDTRIEDLLNIARQNNLMRYPVYRGTRANIIGIVNVLDVISDDPPPQATAQDFMRPPQLISGDTLTDEVLPRMRMTRQPIALVTDAQSSITGLVTINDVLTQIVGELTLA
ncbi:MAG: HlyC/CorC family transporter [Spartobacteria bacterium]|nr:HlyC/CorC family transporter [Spartobacteria bacterium]